MSTINDPLPESHPSVPEELVAYLDGELSPDECRRVEERLAVDADYRQQLGELDQAWEALDSLPSTAVDDDFARTTIEMASLAAQQEQSEHLAAAATARRHRRHLLAIAGVAAAILGFVAARQLWPSADEALLRNLPIIQQLDLLSEIPEVDFLRRLPKSVRLDQLAADESSVEREVAQIQAASAVTMGEREQWVKSLRPEQKANLAARAKEFKTLQDSSEAEYNRLLELEREIANDDQVNQLRETMAAYGAWLADRTEGEKQELRDLPTAERIDRIQKLVQRENRLAARRLEPDEAEKLRGEILKIAEDRRNDFIKELDRRGGDRPLPRPDGPPKDAMAMMIVTWQLYNDETEKETRERLLQHLKPAAREYWESIDRSRRSRNRQLVTWMHEAMRPKRKPGDLEKFFSSDELSYEDKERLLNMSRREMEIELERLYFASQSGLYGRDRAGGWDWQGLGRRPRPGDDGPPDNFGPPPGPPPLDGRPGGERYEPERRGPRPEGSRRRDNRRDEQSGDRPRPDRPPPPDAGPKGPPPPNADEEPI